MKDGAEISVSLEESPTIENQRDHLSLPAIIIRRGLKLWIPPIITIGEQQHVAQRVVESMKH